jgi:hypothetical protein
MIQIERILVGGSSHRACGRGLAGLRAELRPEEPGDRAFGRGTVERGLPGGHEAVEDVEDLDEALSPLAVDGSFPREEEFSRQHVVGIRDQPLGADDLPRDLGLEDDTECAEEWSSAGRNGLRSASRRRTCAIWAKCGLPAPRSARLAARTRSRPRQMVSRARSSRPGRILSMWSCDPRIMPRPPRQGFKTRPRAGPGKGDQAALAVVMVWRSLLMTPGLGQTASILERRSSRRSVSRQMSRPSATPAPVRRGGRPRSDRPRARPQARAGRAALRDRAGYRRRGRRRGRG